MPHFPRSPWSWAFWSEGQAAVVSRLVLRAFRQWDAARRVSTETYIRVQSASGQARQLVVHSTQPLAIDEAQQAHAWEQLVAAHEHPLWTLRAERPRT